mmetsp:Transcript_30009/g.86380  ORF Transcript_30009/g.86380 Transcript_30009/m.86380 type:complete len:294 (+) Transcript_30009:150-1031(+)
MRPTLTQRAAAVRGTDISGMTSSSRQALASMSKMWTLLNCLIRGKSPEDSSQRSPPTTTAQGRDVNGYAPLWLGRLITAAWQPMRPSGMSAIRWERAAALNGASPCDSSSPSAGTDTSNISPDASDGAPPTTRRRSASMATAAAVVRGYSRRVPSNVHWPVQTSKSSTVGCVSARPKTSSQPPMAARYRSPGSVTTREPDLAICSGAHEAHEFVSGSYTSHVFSVSMKVSRGCAPGCNEQPPTMYILPRKAAQPWPHRARASGAAVPGCAQHCSLGSKMSQDDKRPSAMPRSL